MSLSYPFQSQKQPSLQSIIVIDLEEYASVTFSWGLVKRGSSRSER